MEQNSKKIRTVIIGMGRMGITRYNAMKRHGGYDVVAVCDISKENLSGYEIPTYMDWKQCIDETDPEAVVVCTVNKFIPDVVIYALEKGKAVFSEKPPGRNLTDAEKMHQARMETGGILKFGFNHRMHNSVIEAKALIESGVLGEVVCIRGVYGKAGNINFPNEWRNNPEQSGGGILLDQGIHMLDLMCYLLNSNLNVVYSSVDNLVWKSMETEDSALAIMETDKHQIATLHSNAIQWRHKFDMDIILSDGYVALNGLLTSTKSYGEERLTYYKKDLEMKTGHLGKPKEHTMCFDEDFSWDLEMEDFYDVVRKHKQLIEGSSEEAVRVMRIIDQIYSDNGLYGRR